MEKNVENTRLFERVMDHLLGQGKKASDDVSCLYRGPDGTKCAVGCIIPDDLYDPDMEGCVAFEVKHSVENPEKIRGLWQAVEYRLQLTAEQKDMLGRLQVIHDQIPVEEWPVAFKALHLWEFGY